MSDNIVRMNCQLCGMKRPLQRVTLEQNIGVIVLRIPTTLSGLLCRACIRETFWTYTLITAIFGWWGVFSFFHTLFIIPCNIYAYLSTRGLPER